MFDKIKDFWEMPMFLKAAVGFGLLSIILAIVFLLAKDANPVKGVPLSKDYEQYKEKLLGGREVIKVVQGAFTETPIVINNKITGHIQSYGPQVLVEDTTVGSYCGYPSIKGEYVKDGYNKDINYILNSSHKEYVNSEMKYQSYHVCNENGTRIAVYFEQLGGK